MRTGTLASGVLAIALLAATAATADDCITLIADLSGPVMVGDSAETKAKDRWPAQLLQCLPARRVVTLDAAARATLFFPEGTRSFELVGPGRYEVTRDGVRPVNGSPAVAQRVLNQAFQNVRLDRSVLTAAGVRMRSPTGARITLLEPRGVVADPSTVSFRWHRSGDRQAPVRFRLASASGEVIYETTSDAEQLVLPEASGLSPGGRFLWRVEDLTLPPLSAPRWESFVVATEQVQALARQLDARIGSPSRAEANLRDLLLMQNMTADN
jgi:hypothetical protein